MATNKSCVIYLLSLRLHIDIFYISSPTSLGILQKANTIIIGIMKIPTLLFLFVVYKILLK